MASIPKTECFSLCSIQSKSILGYAFEAAALGTVNTTLKNIVIVDNKDYVGLDAASRLTQNGIAGFQAVEEGYPLPSALVAVFGTNVSGKSEITNPPEVEKEEPTEPSEPSESTKPTTKPTKPTKPQATDGNAADSGSNDMTGVIIGIVVAVVVIGAAVTVVIVLKKKAKQ